MLSRITDFEHCKGNGSYVFLFPYSVSSEGREFNLRIIAKTVNRIVLQGWVLHGDTKVRFFQDIEFTLELDRIPMGRLLSFKIPEKFQREENTEILMDITPTDDGIVCVEGSERLVIFSGDVKGVFTSLVKGERLPLVERQVGNIADEMKRQY